MTAHEFDTILRNDLHPDNFGRALGYQTIEFNRDERRATVALEIRTEHLSPAGKVHGGVISALLDYTSGAAAFTTLGPGEHCSTVELKVNYFVPLVLGDRLEARGRVVFRGRRLSVQETFLFRNGEPDPVAMATATFNIYEAKSRADDQDASPAQGNRAKAKSGKKAP